jgi:hypothetical protein
MLGGFGSSLGIQSGMVIMTEIATGLFPGEKFAESLNDTCSGLLVSIVTIGVFAAPLLFGVMQLNLDVNNYSMIIWISLSLTTLIYLYATLTVKK